MTGLDGGAVAGGFKCCRQHAISVRMQRKTGREKKQVVAEMAEGSRRVMHALRELQKTLLVAAGQVATAGSIDIHQGRVAARRLRSLLKTFRPLLNVRRARLMRADLRSFARALARVREADVRRDMLVELSKLEPRVSPRDHRRLVGLLDDQCSETRDSLRRHRAEPGWAALLAALGGDSTISELAVRPDVSLADLLQLVDDSWQPAIRLLKREPTEAAELHALRLALKHCRYALEPLADVQPKDTTPLLRRLRAAQDRIGEHRDVLLAAQWVAANERALGAPLTRLLLEVLRRHEKRRRGQAAGRARRTLPAYRAWRKATRSLRRARSTGPA